jgi:hypothetical protein
LAAPVGKGTSACWQSALAASGTRKQLQRAVQGLLARQQSIQSAQQQQQQQEEEEAGVSEEWSQAAQLVVQQAGWMLQQLPGVAAAMWRPPPAWQMLLGQTVAGEAP